MIFSGNKHSSVALNQNHIIVLSKMFETNAKYQHLINVPKSKWNDVDESTVNNFYKIDNR